MSDVIPSTKFGEIIKAGEDQPEKHAGSEGDENGAFHGGHLLGMGERCLQKKFYLLLFYPTARWLTIRNEYSAKITKLLYKYVHLLYNKSSDSVII